MARLVWNHFSCGGHARKIDLAARSTKHGVGNGDISPDQRQRLVRRNLKRRCLNRYRDWHGCRKAERRQRGNRQHSGLDGIDVELGAIGHLKIVGGGGREGAADIQAGGGAKDEAGRIDEKEVCSGEVGGPNGAPDVRSVPPIDTADDIAGWQRRFIEEVRDVVGRDTELAEAMEEIRSITGPRAPSDVVVDLAIGQRDGCADLGVET